MLASNSQRSIYLCLPSADTRGVHHHYLAGFVVSNLILSLGLVWVNVCVSCEGSVQIFGTCGPRVLHWESALLHPCLFRVCSIRRYICLHASTTQSLFWTLIHCNFMCWSVCLHVCVPCGCSTCRGQKRALDALELESLMIPVLCENSQCSYPLSLLFVLEYHPVFITVVE